MTPWGILTQFVTLAAKMQSTNKNKYKEDHKFISGNYIHNIPSGLLSKDLPWLPFKKGERENWQFSTSQSKTHSLITEQLLKPEVLVPGSRKPLIFYIFPAGLLALIYFYYCQKAILVIISNSEKINLP